MCLHAVLIMILVFRKEQIISASSVNAGDVDNATMCDCLIHALAFPWKFMASLIPPPYIFGGWLCFIVALIVIGFVTAIIGWSYSLCHS